MEDIFTYDKLKKEIVEALEGGNSDGECLDRIAKIIGWKA